ncbi:efflux RND transporter periplasmic adaptor subunit [Methylocapsa sp. S129]|uniref:efflux RND transporter periplasmic adaptor subunit n=1 Tax=Methylocapsa sp. S129 TaxID=1641869 RepID=UPI00131AC426|nr:efflux RND transporter periplasmic adaptor subunit [Methylocapsa sp. S129]
MIDRRVRFLPLLLAPMLGLATPAAAQRPPSGPPAVGVTKAETLPITETNSFVGRVQAINRVDLVARVTAFLEEQKFVEGAEVKPGDLLYQLERGPFAADVAAKQAAVEQAQAQLQLSGLTLGRAQTLLNTPAGQQSTVDSARATQLSNEAVLAGAQAQLDASKINLNYTEIRSPIAGKIGRTAVTSGNVVSPGSGVLATIVGQDPMYVLFSISTRTGLELRQKYASAGGFAAVVIHLKLPDGRMYGQTGHVDFVDNTIATNTDTIALRGTIANPTIDTVNGNAVRELVDGEFVTVQLEGVEPVQLLAIPRAAVMSDQQGDFVYTVDADNKAVVTRVKLGQTSGTLVSILSGLKLGDSVITEGIQRARPGQPVNPAPAGAGPPPQKAPGAAP